MKVAVDERPVKPGAGPWKISNARLPDPRQRRPIRAARIIPVRTATNAGKDSGGRAPWMAGRTSASFSSQSLQVPGVPVDPATQACHENRRVPAFGAGRVHGDQRRGGDRDVGSELEHP